MVTDVGMSAVAIVTSAATMTTMLGKSSVWQPGKHANADNCEKNSQESRFHHFGQGCEPCGLRVLRFAMDSVA